MVDQERGDYREHMDHYRVSYSDYTIGVWGSLVLVMLKCVNVL